MYTIDSAHLAAFSQPAALPSLHRPRIAASSSTCVRRGHILPTCSTNAASATGAATAIKPDSKKAYNITLLPGDGIGPEILDASVRVLNAVSKKHEVTLNYSTANIGGAALDAEGSAFPDTTLELCKASDAVLLACIGGPKWDNNTRENRPESGLLRLRKELNLFANLRPAKAYDMLLDSSPLKKDVVDGTDIMVVRELTGDVYFGKPAGLEHNGTERVGYNNMIYYEHEVRRIAKVAFDIAKVRPGKRVTSVDKANVLDVSQLWRDVVIETHKNEYSDAGIELNHMYIDNAAMQLIQYPKQFDTIVTGNIFGDILSDAASIIVGSLGMLPSASLGEAGTPGVFEPVHGSAPDITGMNLANPSACILSAAMLLRYGLGLEDMANDVEAAVKKTLLDGWRTNDIKDSNTEKSFIVGCDKMADEIVKRVL